MRRNLPYQIESIFYNSKKCRLLFLVLVFCSSTFAQQPIISSFTPASGPAGTPVIITGSNFNATAANNIVFFGAVKGTVTAASANSLMVTVPAGATYQPISVTTNALTGYSLIPFVSTFSNGTSITGNCFTPKIDSTTDLHPNGVAVADFDGDGKPDIATPNNYSTTGQPASVSILRNTGSTGAIAFAPKTDLVTGVLTYAIAAGDLNGDGKPDLVSSSITDKTISVFRNTSTAGNISFATKVDYATGDNPFSIAINDIDGDGKPDIVVANYLSNTISVYRNASTGGILSFATKADFVTALGPRNVATGDFDADGKPDIAVTNEFSNSVSIFKNNSTAGNIVLGAKADYTTGTAPFGVAVGDLNNDGKLDLAVSNNNSTSFSAFKNTSTTGTISFAAKADFAAGASPYLITIGDINGDARPDIILPSFNLSVSENISTAGNISFAARVFFGLAPNAFAVAVADLDGDGKNDLAGAVFTSNKVSLLRNRNKEPAINNFFPSTAATGTMVTILGENFSNASAVYFGGTAASSFTIVNNTTITAIVGAGVSGAVSVVNPFATGKMDGFLFAGPPVISSFTPTSTGQGQTVIITGNNFNNATAVSFGGTAAISYTIASPTTINAVLGTGASGSVSVTTNYGTGTLAGFTFVPFPNITSFTPTSAAAGSSVTITGINLNGATAVSFGSTPATSFIINSPASITAIVGSGASGIVNVTTSFGTGTLAGFTFIPSPIINTFTPLTGQTGTAITITGVNFTGATSVSFGSLPVNSFTVVSPTIITAIVGSGATGNVTVTGPGGVSALSGFIFIPAPTIASITPDKGSAGSTFIINGSGFNPSVSGNKVTIGSIQAPVTAATSTSLSVTSPFTATNKSVSVLTNNLIASSIVPFRTTYTVPDTSFKANSFSPPIKINGGVNSYNSLNIDIDGDGKLDIISGDIINKTVVILRNTSSGNAISFAPKLNIPSFWIPDMIVAGDLDGDGKPELICGNESFSNTLSIFKNTSTPGNISFATRLDYATNPCAVMQVALGDMDNDGRKDIIVRLNSTNLVDVLVYRNKSTVGTIAVDAPVAFYIGNCGNTTSDILTEDLDGDGRLEIVATKPDLTCLVNKSTPGILSFSTPVTIFPTGANAFSYMAIADVNEDNKKDIVSLVGSSITVFKNQSTAGNINFSPNPVYTFTSNVKGISAGDLNGDGKPEIVVLQGAASNINQFSVFNNMCTTSAISFATKTSYIYPTVFGFGISDVGDIDGDNKMDIILTGGSADSTFIFRNLMTNSSIQICNNSNAVITSSISGTTYQWQQSIGAGFINIIDNINFTGTNSMNLQINNPSVSWTGYQYRCLVDNINTSNITTISVNASAIANAGNDTAICTGATAQLHATGGSIYSWSPAASLNNPTIANPIASPAANTVYIVTVSNGNNCFSKDTIAVTVNTVSAPVVTVNTSSNNICSGNTAIFTAGATNGGVSPAYQWLVNGIISGINSNIFTSTTLNNNDQIKVILTSNAACATIPTATSNIITMAVQAQLAIPLVTLSNRVFTVTNPDAAVTYTWQTQTNGIWADITPASNGISYTATVAGEYRVKAVKGVCTSYSVSQVTNFTNRIPANNAYGIYLYPNPASNMVSLDSIKLNQQWETLDLIATDGKQVAPTANIKNQTSVSIDIRTLKNGTYIVQLRKKNGEFTTLKFVKQ